MHKYEILPLLHEVYNPQLYFEIGVDKGESLRIAKCEAVGVDPHPDIGGNVNKAEVHRLDSDVFFERKLLKGRKPDLVFIDGLHHFDQVIKDFVNVEKTCKKDTVVVIDDILPAHEGQTPREWLPGSWTGDVWKIIPILKEHRPDLKIVLLDSSPTGLMLVTNLDATNNVLTENYDEIRTKWIETPVPQNVVSHEDLDVRKDIEEQVRNFRSVTGKRILCFVNHYYNPTQTDGFKGGATTTNPEREVIVKKVIDRVKSIDGCDVKICGIKGFTVPGVEVDFDFTGKAPHHIVYESLNLMAKYTDKYDYFINIEDDIWLGDDVLRNIFEFDATGEINEIFLPNRIEITGKEWNLIDLSVTGAWTNIRKAYKGGMLGKSTNHHSGLLIMRTDKFKKAVGMLDKGFREIWFGGPMASAFAYFHTPFTLYRNFHPTKYHTVIHLDKWKNNERANTKFINTIKKREKVPKTLKGKDSIVTGLCIVYNTKDVFQKAYESIREHHVDLPLLIIDNSDKSNDCYTYVKSLESEYTKVIHVDQNIGHGRGMDMGLRMIKTPYALIFDSDIEMVKSPVAQMLKMMDDDTFGVGWIYNIGLDGQDYGFRHKAKEPRILYLHPYFQLVNVKNYKKFHPYVHHGAPCYLTMVDIWEKKLSSKILKQFDGLTGHTVYPFKPWTPVPSQYVNHKFAQTRNMNIAAGKSEIIGTWVKRDRNAIEAKIPYGLNGDLAGAYNEAMESASTNWVLLLDQDIFLCNPNWYTMCLEAINKAGPKVGLITCVTNFVETYNQQANEESQKADILVTTTNIEDHIKAAKDLYQKHGANLRRVTSYKVAGFFMLVNKEIWRELQFTDIGTGLKGIDWNYCKRLLSHGYEIYEMPGLYVFHRRDLRLLNFEVDKLKMAEV
jgi:GT2 family glycosyltransferase